MLALISNGMNWLVFLALELRKPYLRGMPLEYDMSNDEVTGYGNQTCNHYRKASPESRPTKARD